jgi:hypothetical protein
MATVIDCDGRLPAELQKVASDLGRLREFNAIALSKFQEICDIKVER